MIGSMSRPVVRFWSRKPFDICAKYIAKYSNRGDVVLDSFGGSGSIVQTALLLGRRAIYIDANPYAWLVAYVSINGVEDVDKYLEAVREVLSRRRIYYMNNGSLRWLDKRSLYTQHCPICGVLREVKYYGWYNEKCKAVLSCGHEVSCSDLEDNISPIYPYPRNLHLYYDIERKIPFDKRRNVDYIHELFTRRNLIILASILHDIDSIAHKYPVDVVLALYLTFTSILYDSSKMARKNAGSWGVPSYWIPAKHIEKNPYKLFETRARKMAKYFRILNEIRSEIDYKVTTDLKKVIDNKATIAITQGNALNLKEIEDDSIDLVFTDPPHTGEIQYFELSYFYWSWLIISNKYPVIIRKILKKNPGFDFSMELNINSRQGKTFTYYIESLKNIVRELYRIARTNKYIILIFHEENHKIKKTIYDQLIRMYNPIILAESVKQREIGERNKTGKFIDIIIFRKTRYSEPFPIYSQMTP